MDDSTNYHLLKTLESNPELTQRDIAREMGISLGKANYCLRALMDKGFVKARNFKNSRKRSAYAYILTPKGAEEKARVTYRFLKRKLREYEELKQEIEELKQECEGGKARK
jgi:EPS-associated MarR family transcriptional regulator